MTQQLIDSFGREITYLRLSVTDRCDLRCTYCMAENMTFLPRKDLLSLEELATLCESFIKRGIKKIRITGGEPLVRRDLMSFMHKLSKHRISGKLDEITLTTNGTLLSRYAKELKLCGVERINISLDTLDPIVFTKLTRRNALDAVLKGIDTALEAGIKVKINTVALKGVNDREIPSLIEWAHSKSMDITLIEVMPLGDIDEDRVDQYIPLNAIRDNLEQRFTLNNVPLRTGGPARYAKIKETGGILGMITPLTNNFCAGCNRVRVTCTGQIYTCLGHGHKLDLRAAIRGDNSDAELERLLGVAMREKPEKHFFDISERGAKPTVARHMSVTGG
ncbi:GTP 3',8-cyclase MoaA [Hellea sp.]|jgi:cyclic pyranopterin phosphate synthase|nr:GTP 3',8-cyclase MoaA [Hellea sp.]MDA8997078.1 GTP 3',8-cyclase MoaA [Hellea sp.]